MSFAKYYSGKAVYSKVGRGRLNGILELMPKKDYPVLLDVGCGSGEVGRLIKEKRDVKVFGIDVSPNAVDDAKKVLDGAYVCNLEDAVDLPGEITGHHYDAIILSEVLEHLLEPERLLQRLRVFEKPIIVTVPNILFWKNRLKILFGSFTYTETGLMDRGHIHFFSWQSFQDTIVSAGYCIDSVHHHIPTRGTRFLSQWFPGLFAYQFCVRIKPM